MASKSATTTCLCSCGGRRRVPTRNKDSSEVIVLRRFRSSELAVLGAIFQFSGMKPKYLGVQKNLPSLMLCPATKNCASTSENLTDSAHYAPPWNYNPICRRKPISKEAAKE